MILLAALFVYLVCRACGHLLLRNIQGRESFLEFTLGAAIFSTIVFLLAATHLLYTPILLTTGLALCLCGAANIGRGGLSASRNRTSAPTLPLPWHLLFYIPYLTFGTMYLIVAMAPETSPDGTGYHLGLVTRYLDHHGFYTMPNYMFAGLAQGIEMLFIPAFALGRHSAAAVVHLLFLLTLPVGMRAWARRQNLEKAGIVAALLFYLAPVVGRDGTIAYNDVATAAIVFAAFSLIELWRCERNNRLLIPAGILTGFIFCCKMTAAPFAIYAFFAVLLTAGLGPAAILTTTALLTAAPWLVKNAIEFHNPFFPLFNHWFPNPWMYQTIEDELRAAMRTMGGVKLPDLPYQAIIGGKLAGVLGPVFILAPLALLALRRKPGRLLLLAFLPVFLPFFTNTGARFLIPSLPFLALAMAIGLMEIPKLGVPLAVLAVLTHATLSWPDMIERWTPGYQWRIDRIDYRAALRLQPEDEFLRANWGDYKPGLMLDRLVPPGDLVYSPSMGQMAYQHRTLLGNFDSALGRRTFFTLLMPVVKELGTTLNTELRFPPVTTTKIRLIADAKRDTDIRISELHYLHGDQAIPPAPAWRSTASDNPWELHYAFDARPVSWWTSGRYMEPGMWIETDFGQPTTLDRIALAQSEDQRWLPLNPWAWIDGHWKALDASSTNDTEPPRPTLRRETRDELKRLGIHWILIKDGGYGADDLRDHAAEWGIHQVGMENNYRLYTLR